MSRMHASFSLAPLAILLASVTRAQVTTVPTDVQMPGTQPGEVTLESANRCDNCHAGYDVAVEPVRNWWGGMMAHAVRDPLYWATVAVAEHDFPGAGDLCLRCHSPQGWAEGRSTPTDGSALRGADVDGVSCDVCHQLTNPDDSEHLGVQDPPFVANDGGSPPAGYHGSGMFVLDASNDKLGPYSDPASPHQALPSDFHRSSALCGTCHDVSNPVVGDLAPGNGAMTPLAPGTFSGVPGAPVETKAAFNNFPHAYGVVERTYSEHVASDLSTLRVSDYATLPVELQAGAIQKAHADALASTPSGDYVDGDPRTFSCQSCHMPPVTGRGCDRSNAPIRADLPLHDMTGANTWVPAAIVALDDETRLVLGNGLGTEQRAALARGVLRSRANLPALRAPLVFSVAVEVQFIAARGVVHVERQPGFDQRRCRFLAAEIGSAECLHPRRGETRCARLLAPDEHREVLPVGGGRSRILRRSRSLQHQAQSADGETHKAWKGKTIGISRAAAHKTATLKGEPTRTKSLYR
jgi:hypothetical protein